MANITLKNNPITTNGELPQIGKSAMNFSLIGKDLKAVSLQDFEGQRLILNIFPYVGRIKWVARERTSGRARR